MPHTNRKKKNGSATSFPATSRPASKIVHTKRQQIEDDDGWTHIIDAPQKFRAQASSTHSIHIGDFETNGVSYMERTMEELTADWDYYHKQWSTSEAAIHLRERLSTVEPGAEQKHLKVTNVVCLGLGSLQVARREGRRASFTQLAALQTLIRILASDQQLPCIIQDPQFTPLDKQFLASLDFVVLDDPAAFSAITENSLVYAIHCYGSIYSSIAAGKKPAMIVGTDVENFGKFDLSEKTQSVLRDLENLVDTCDTYDVPQVRHDFSDTRIYWRRVQTKLESV